MGLGTCISNTAAAGFSAEAGAAPGVSPSPAKRLLCGAYRWQTLGDRLGDEHFSISQKNGAVFLNLPADVQALN